MICISIAAAQTDDMIERMERAAPWADLVELRIDRMRNPELERLLRSKRTPVIATNRPRREGGGFSGTEKERVAILIEAVRLGAEYVDVEASTDPDLKAELRSTLAERPAKLIVSWHDFSGTPPEEILQEKLTACMMDGPDIAKIVTHASEAADCLRLLGIIPFARQRGQAIIAFCMGGRGRISRLMAPLLGSVISYASLEPEEASAPGQMTIHQIREINRILEGPGHE